GEDDVAERVKAQAARGQAAGPAVIRVVVGEVGLHSGLELGGLLLTRARGARGGRRGTRLEAQDLVDVGAASGRAGEAEQEAGRKRTVGGGDAVELDELVVRACVDSLGSAEEASCVAFLLIGQ